MSDVCLCVVFDCDGVLVDSVSSWKTLHDGFGTDNSKNLSRFIAGEISDVEFMRSDIAMWKEIRSPIHRDELFRMYSGISLMPGARELVAKLQDHGVYVAIVSAGVDIFVSSIAALLKVDDWIANGFEFDEDDCLGYNAMRDHVYRGYSLVGGDQHHDMHITFLRYLTLRFPLAGNDARNLLVVRSAVVCCTGVAHVLLGGGVYGWRLLVCCLVWLVVDWLVCGGCLA